MRLLALAIVASCGIAATPVAGVPVAYVLEQDRSSVGFEVDWVGEKVSGRMLIASADLVIDFDQVARSSVNVRIDVPSARTNLPFATQMMLGESVLDAAHFDAIAFKSSSVRRNGDGARIEGLVTIRGVTLPMTLAARIYRQTGSEVGDRDNLSVLLTGAIRRSAFGASGWADVVGDEVRVKILARIQRSP